LELREAIGKAFVIWEQLWKPVTEPGPTMLSVWETAIAGANITPEQFNSAALIATQKLSFWPKPADIMAIIKEPEASSLPHYYAEFKPLPMPQEPPITPEQKKEILASMKHEGAKHMFLSVVYGDEHGKIEREA
jgi:hypothetical protein